MMANIANKGGDMPKQELTIKGCANEEAGPNRSNVGRFPEGVVMRCGVMACDGWFERQKDGGHQEHLVGICKWQESSERS